VCFLLGLRLSIVRLGQLEGEAREQALIVLSGIAFASLLGLAYGLAVVLYPLQCKSEIGNALCTVAQHRKWLYDLPALVLALCFGVALKWPGEIDAENFFRRTTLFGALGWLVIFGFATLEHVIVELFGHLLSDETPRTIAAGAIGLAVHPVKTRLESGIELLLKKVLL
jgi:hypothetical protein